MGERIELVLHKLAAILAAAQAGESLGAVTLVIDKGARDRYTQLSLVPPSPILW